MLRIPNLRRAYMAAGGIALSAYVIGGAVAETPVERGAYLVTTIGSCGNCHSPRDAPGHVAAGKELSGGNEFDEDLGHVIGPNITPDRETGIGAWSEAQIITAMREGKRPDGTIIGPPMPIIVYRSLSDQDTAAIAAYLLSLPPIHNPVGRTRYKIPLPPSYGPPVAHVAEPARDDKVGYGRYLATFGHCVLCHTAPGGGQPVDMSHAFAGGRELPNGDQPPAGVVISRNITSDPDQGIGKWSDEQIKRALVEGVRPDGTKLSHTMPYTWYANLAPADLDAIVAFLRTVPPIKTPTPGAN
jgi:mono/diheme cytochrome c family protein